MQIQFSICNAISCSERCEEINYSFSMKEFISVQISLLKKGCCILENAKIKLFSFIIPYVKLIIHI